MAAIAHAAAEVTSPQTTTSAAYVDIPSAAIASGNFTAGKKYLLLATAQVNNTTANTFNWIRAVHGSTAFAESEQNFVRDIGLDGLYGFMTVWTAVSGEGVKLQFKANAGTIAVDQIALIAICLSDDVLENTDWFFNERTTDDALSTTFTDGASITFTPAVASDDWLVISYAQIDPGDATNRMISRLERSGEASSTEPEAGHGVTSASAQSVFLLSRVFTLGNASNTFKERAATSSGTAHTRLHSAIFAINLAKFKEHAKAYTAGPTTLAGGTNFGDQVQTVSITPSVQGDVLIGAYWGCGVIGSQRRALMRVQLDAADQPATQTADGYEFTQSTLTSDVLPMALVTLPAAVTAAAHTIDLDSGRADGQDLNAYHAALWAFTMELAPVTATAKEFTARGRGLGRGLGRGAR